MKTLSLYIGFCGLLAAWLSPLHAQDTDTVDCYAAFGLSPEHRWPPTSTQYTLVAPAVVAPGKKQTICVVDSIDVDFTTITRDGSKTTASAR
jgi:hypothetical protein